MHIKPPPTWAKGDGERDPVTAAESRPRRRRFRILLQTRIRECMDRLILSSPRTCPMAVDRIQHRLCAGRNPDELRMCPTQDAARTLAEAGYGVALLPAMGCRRDSGLTFVPVRDSGRLSYGIYCFSAAQKPETKRFIQYMKEAFSPS